jgi:outer membrane protein TolC
LKFFLSAIGYSLLIRLLLPTLSLCAIESPDPYPVHGKTGPLPAQASTSQVLLNEESGGELYIPVIKDASTAHIEIPQPYKIEILLQDQPYAEVPLKKKRLSLLDAVEETLANQLDIQLAVEQFYFRQGALQESAGPFDPVFNSVDTYTISQDVQLQLFTKTKRASHETVLFANASKKTRLGTTYSLSTGIDQVINPAFVPRRYTTGFVAFTVQHPLLRGYRYGRDSAIERANWFELEASYYDTLQEISLRIFNTCTAYWEFVAAEKVRIIRANAVSRFEGITSLIEKLASQDQLARTDILQPLAQLAAKKFELQTAEQEFYRTFEELKFAMNNVEEWPCAHESLFAMDEFPKISFTYESFIQQQCALLRKSAASRYDLQAIASRIQAAVMLVQGARNGLLPQLDVVGGVAKRNFETGRDSKSVASPFSNGPGQTDWTVGVNFSVPLYNDSAEGILRQQQALYAQARLRSQQTTQNVLKDLRQAISDQVTLAAALLDVNDSVSKNESLVHNERIKLGVGISTPFFLINFENSLTDALIQQVAAYKGYIQNIARLRFLTGTLFTVNDCIETIIPEDLISLEIAPKL